MTLKFVYKNWKGEIQGREVQPIKIWYGSTKWHPEEQWFLKAKDVAKGEVRDFALIDIQKFVKD